jgi:hypothetical protein
LTRSPLTLTAASASPEGAHPYGDRFRRNLRRSQDGVWRVAPEHASERRQSSSSVDIKEALNNCGGNARQEGMTVEPKRKSGTGVAKTRGGAQERRVGNHHIRRQERVLETGLPVLDTNQCCAERNPDRASEPRRLLILGPIRRDLIESASNIARSASRTA